MLSVIIINSNIYNRYLKYTYFFKWFEDREDLAVCVWNKEASVDADIREMVPDLYDTVWECDSWNAYIVDEPFRSDDYIERDLKELTQFSINPYERGRKRKDYDVHADPLMRLSFFLGGVGVEEPAFFDKYRFSAVRPEQIYLITPRIFSYPEVRKLELRHLIEDKLTHADDGMMDIQFIPYADFWGRYHYPVGCRFLVFDLPGEGSSQFEYGWLRLWFAVVTLAKNPFIGAEAGGQKLYTLQIGLSSSEMETFLNRFYTALMRSKEEAERRMEDELEALRAELANTTSTNPGDCAPIVVHFKDTVMSRFFVPWDRFGLTKESPEPDEEVWREHCDDVSEETVRLFKAVRRGKDEAAARMTESLILEEKQMRRRQLTPYDMEDIREAIQRTELELVGLKTDRVAEQAGFEEEEHRAAKEVAKALKPRVRFGTFLGLVFIGAAAGLGGFIPYVASSARFNTVSAMIAACIALFAEALIAAAAFVGLSIQKRRLNKTLGAYEEAVRSNLETVRNNADVQSRYLTLLLNYMVKYDALTNCRIEDRYAGKIAETVRISSVFEGAVRECRELAAQNQIRLTVDEDDPEAGSILFDPDKPICLHEDTEDCLIALNGIPAQLDTPFRFIEGLEIRAETVYETEMPAEGEAEGEADGAKDGEEAPETKTV